MCMNLDKTFKARHSLSHFSIRAPAGTANSDNQAVSSTCPNWLWLKILSCHLHWAEDSWAPLIQHQKDTTLLLYMPLNQQKQKIGWRHPFTFYCCHLSWISLLFLHKKTTECLAESFPMQAGVRTGRQLHRILSEPSDHKSIFGEREGKEM